MLNKRQRWYVPKYHDANRPWLQTHLLALLIYLLLSVVLTWPLVVHWNTAVVGGLVAREAASPDYNPRFEYGGFEDAAQNVWNVWWTGRAVEHQQNPFWSPMLYYPQGVQMYLQTLNLPSTLAAQPINYLAGPIAAYNLSVLLACTLTAYGAFLLVRAFVPGTAIPLLCGALFTASPFHMMKIQSNQLNLISMQWLPLYVLALLWLDRVADAQTRRRADTDTRIHEGLLHRCIAASPHRFIGFAVIMFVLAALTDWYWALICAIYTAIWWTISLARSPQRGQLLRRYVAFGVGVLVCLTPVFIGIARMPDDAWPASASFSAWRGYIQGYSADALGMFFPSAFHPLWGANARALLEPVSAGYAPDGWYIAAGWVLLSCAGLGVWWSWREHWRLLVIGAIAWVLSLGPSLRLANIETGLPLPYALLQDVPFLGMARRPSHVAVICIVLAAVFAGIGLQRLSRRWTTRQRAMLVLVVGALAVVELWPPQRRIFTFEQPPVYQRLREAPGVVADLPLEWTETSRSLRNQLVHTQPIMGGYVARRPEYYTRRYIPTLNWITSMQHGPDIVPLTPAALAAMQCYYPVRHVVLRRDLTPAADQQELAAALAAINAGPLQPAFEDYRYVWYELPLFADKCQPFVFLGSGWHAREYNATRQWRWASGSNQIWLVNPFETAIAATVKLDMEAYDTARPVEIWNDTHVLGRWNVARARRPYVFVVRLPPGVSQLELRAPALFDDQTRRHLSVSVSEVAIQSYSLEYQ